MYDLNRRLLYVGKAKDLRARISSYRHVNGERHSGKVLRLVNSIRHIEIETTADEATALLRENELIRLRQPPYNRRSKHPERYGYILLHRCNNGRFGNCSWRSLRTRARSQKHLHLSNSAHLKVSNNSDWA